MNIFNNSSFNTFPGISQNLPEKVSIFFAKMIDLCLLTQKNQTLGRLRERTKRDESDSGDGSGNVSDAGLDLTGSGHSSRRVQGL